MPYRTLLIMETSLSADESDEVAIMVQWSNHNAEKRREHNIFDTSMLLFSLHLLMYMGGSCQQNS